MHAVFPLLESLFFRVVESSWQASLLVAAILIIQRLFRNQLNARWSYALWLLVLARLLLPEIPSSIFSIFQFAPATPMVWVLPAVSATVAIPFTPAPAPLFTLSTLLTLIWMTGSLVFLSLTLWVNHRFNRQMKVRLPLENPRLQSILLSARRQLGINREIQLIEHPKITSPAIMGLFRPVLLLPLRAADKFTNAEWNLIFLHELAHLKRGDTLVQWLIALLQIVHWFNPVLWFAFRKIRHDREPATDALVLSKAGESEKQRYGEVLIKLLEHFQQRHSLPDLVGILEDHSQFKKRFQLISRFTQGAYGWSLLALLIGGLTAAIFLTRHPSTREAGILEEKVFEVPAMFSEILKNDTMDGELINLTNRSPFAGVPRPTGSSMTYSKKDKKVSARNTPENLKIIGALIRNPNTLAYAEIESTHGSARSKERIYSLTWRYPDPDAYEPEKIPLLKNETRPIEPFPEEKDRLALEAQKKMRSTLKLGRIEARNMPLGDFMTLLAQKTRDADPEKKGINLVLKAPTEPKNPTVSLSLPNPTLEESLQALEQKLPLYCKYEPYAIFILPKADLALIFENKSFPVSDEFARAFKNAQGPVNLTDSMRSCGLDFPPKSSAWFIPKTKKIMVHNNVANLKKIGDFLSSPESHLLFPEWPNKSGAEFNIQTKLQEGSTQVTLPSLQMDIGESSAISKTQTFSFPTEFEPPQKVNQNGMDTLIPSWPSEFQTVEVGWRIEYSVKEMDSYLQINGKAVYTPMPQLENRVYGEETGPIRDKETQEIISQNKTEMVAYQAITTYFQINAKSGKPYQVKLKRGDQIVEAEIICQANIP